MIGLALTVGVFFLCAQLLKRVPTYLLPGQGVLFRIIMKQTLDRYTTLYLLESLGKVYLVASAPQGMQVLQTFEMEQAEKLVSTQSFQFTDFLKSKLQDAAD